MDKTQNQEEILKICLEALKEEMEKEFEDELVPKLYELKKLMEEDGFI